MLVTSIFSFRLRIISPGSYCKKTPMNSKELNSMGGLKTLSEKGYNAGLIENFTPSRYNTNGFAKGKILHLKRLKQKN